MFLSDKTDLEIFVRIVSFDQKTGNLFLLLEKLDVQLHNEDPQEYNVPLSVTQIMLAESMTLLLHVQHDAQSTEKRFTLFEIAQDCAEILRAMMHNYQSIYKPQEVRFIADYWEDLIGHVRADQLIKVVCTMEREPETGKGVLSMRFVTGAIPGTLFKSANGKWTSLGFQLLKMILCSAIIRSCADASPTPEGVYYLVGKLAADILVNCDPKQQKK